MARFVSRIAQYSHGVQSEISEDYATGGRKVLQRLLEAKFERKGLTEYEIEQGSKRLSHVGLPQDRDTGADVDPRHRLSLFDSEAAQKLYSWTNEETELVVQTLRSSDRYGQDYIEVEVIKRPAPWKGYDKIEDLEELLSMIDATETDPVEALAYERENRNRPEVVAAIDEMAGDEASDEIVVQA